MSNALSFPSEESCHTSAHLFHSFFDVTSCLLCTIRKCYAGEVSKDERHGRRRNGKVGGDKGVSEQLGLHSSNLLHLLPSCLEHIMPSHPWSVCFFVFYVSFGAIVSFQIQPHHMRITHCGIIIIFSFPSSFYSPHNPRHQCSGKLVGVVPHNRTKSTLLLFCSHPRNEHLER